MVSADKSALYQNFRTKKKACTLLPEAVMIKLRLSSSSPHTRVAIHNEKAPGTASAPWFGTLASKGSSTVNFQDYIH